MIRYPLILAVSLATSLSLSACMNQPSAPSAASNPGHIAAAVADSNRPDADKLRDANRKPVQTLEFLGVKPGEQIAEILPGSGYFTRIFSKAVGPSGHVYALVPERPASAPANLPDLAGAVKAIAADPNYTNVTVVIQPLTKLVTPAPVDLVFTAQNYHDLHNFPVDVVAFNRTILDSLKPGGLYVVLDHSAPAGSGLSDTKTLHRIDADVVKQEVTAAGFEFVGASDVLANAADSRTAAVFDPSIRGKTDQFILKFRKPKK
ncbi:MAG TPA: methyltransferase [Xanthobacteraceae bacterium]|jgi:predicted methyltransferase|nr:methyltransferase [Xanthobacteraceae bacterium]